MSVEEFKKEFDQGEFNKAFACVVKDDVLSAETIYDITGKLRIVEIEPLAVVQLFCHLLTKKKPKSTVSAFQLGLMGIRAENMPFIEMLMESKILETIHESLYGLDQNIQKEICQILAALNNTFLDSSFNDRLKDMIQILKAEGYPIPTNKEMLVLRANSPNWHEGKQCSVCKAVFSTFVRRHHCRCCGSSVCSACSSNSIQLQHLFRNQICRVCLKCFNDLSNFKSKNSIFNITKTDPVLENFKEKNILVNHRSVSNDADDIELQRVLEISLKEEEQRQKRLKKQKQRSFSENKTSNATKERQVNVPTYPTFSEYENIHEYPKNPNLPNLQNFQSTPQTYPNFDLPSAPHYNSFENFPSLTQPNVPLIPIVEKTTDEIDCTNIISTINTLKQRISQVEADPESVPKKQALNTIFQASIGVYDAFQTQREQFLNKLEQHRKCLRNLDLIVKARISLDETRKANSRRIIEQQQQSETLLKMHLEQKLYLAQQQALEMENYKKMLNEQRARMLETNSEPQRSTMSAFDGPSPFSSQTDNYPVQYQENPYSQTSTDVYNMNAFQYFMPQSQQQYSYPPSSNTQPPIYPTSYYSPQQDFLIPDLSAPPVSKSQKEKSSKPIDDLLTFDPPLDQ